MRYNSEIGIAGIEPGLVPACGVADGDSGLLGGCVAFPCTMELTSRPSEKQDVIPMYPPLNSSDTSRKMRTINSPFSASLDRNTVSLDDEAPVLGSLSA
jgi:hypothetical protein